MSINILIVEDLFIEANDLRITLQKAGHNVCGIAKSVDQALAILKKETPDIVLLDIFLKGDLTGIHLAKILSGKNIPFIYLSANSNPSTLEAAKATQPYGFLVKPYREKDILVALDIASYRHKQAMELVSKQEKWLSQLLTGVLNKVTSGEQKLLLLASALKPFIHFDHIFVDTDARSEDPASLYIFQRVGFDEYNRMDIPGFQKKVRVTAAELAQFRKDNMYRRSTVVYTGEEFTNACYKDRLMDKMRQLYGIRSGLLAPISQDKARGMTLSFFSVQEDSFTIEHMELLNSQRTLLATVVENIFAHQKETLLNASIQEDDKALHPDIRSIVGKSPKLLYVLDQVMQVSSFDTTVLISGETGVGKEGLANAIHQLSSRKGKPLIKVNCAAIPDTLIESELFGHEKGAFTNAIDRRIGKFEQAQGGTIFLDEIGELPLPVQSKLLRVLQEKEIERLGGRSTVKIDVRIVAATNRNLYKEVADGKFRMDLYYRINVFPINIPSLRERKEDIPLLAQHFLQQYAALSGHRAKYFSPEAMAQLMSYSWPGNIRELQHLVERHIVMTRSDEIGSVELPDELPDADEVRAGDIELPFQSIADIDKAHIVAALKKCNGKVSGKGGAAEILGINPNTLTSRMKKMGIAWQYILK